MRFTYMINGIHYKDTPLKNAMDIFRNNTMNVGKMNESKATALYLLQNYPVSKKRSEGNKIGVVEISDT